MEDGCDARSAILYIDFAEQGAGLPGFAFIHSRIHSVRDKDPLAVENLRAMVPWVGLSARGEVMLSIGIAPTSTFGAMKDDSRGANTTVSV